MRALSDLELGLKVLELRRAGLPVCLTTIVEVTGSTPRDTGAKMVVCGDGSSFGTIGGGCGESVVRSAALRMLLSGHGSEIVEVDLTSGPGNGSGDVCGGRMRVLIEAF